MVADYYAMLGIDPQADRPALESALARCQPAWSSGTRNPKTKHTFQSYLDQIPEIKRTLLGDPIARRAYDAELLAAKRAERDARLDELQRLVRLRAAKGGLSGDDRAILLERAGRLGLDRDDLDRLAEPFPSRAEAVIAVEAPEPAPDVLDPVARKQIRVALDHLRRRDLYDALGLARDAPGDEIAARADAERRRWMQKTQVTAEKTAWLEVVSHAQSHLGQPAPRARYDRTLALEAEERLGESVAFALRGLAKVDYGTRSALIREAGSLGITSERAETLISRGARALGVAGDAAPALILTSVEMPRFLRCRACSGLSDFDEVAGRPECRHCRASLRWTCPACKLVRWVDEARCACGFPLEHVEPLTRHFDAAQHAHRLRDYPAALEHLRRVQHFAPRHVAARKGIETVRRHMAEADAARSAVEAARAGNRLVAAQAALQAWARLMPDASPEVISVRAEVDRGLRMAEALAARAKVAEADDSRAARSLYEKALAIAADLAEAREGARRCPPEPATGLTAEADGALVRLRWNSPAPDGLGPVRFRVVRKVGGIPSHAGDGSVVAEVDGAEAEDRGVRPGDSAGYAVYTVRDAAIARAGPAAGPVAVLPEVIGLRADARPGEVELSWTLPARAVGARVVRNSRRRPAHDRDGDPVEALAEGATDRGLADGLAYHYAVFALYPAPGGGERPSRGAIATAMPHQPADPVAMPALAPGVDGRLRISWESPARGTVRIFRTGAPLPHGPGDRVPAATAASWEGAWLGAPGDDHAEDPSPPASGVCFYTPILALGGSATVGHAARYSCVADPTDLRAVRAGPGGRVHLRWRWNPRGVGSRVVARAGSPPVSGDDPEGIVAEVSDEEYGRLGYHAMTLPADRPGPWHLAVFAVATGRGEEVISPGIEPSARTVVPGPNPDITVSYAVRRPMFPGRPWSVTFRTEPPGSPVPPMVLVAHPRTVPLSPDDGEIVARFPASRDGETFPVAPTSDLGRRRPRVFADPGSDPDAYPPIRLRHPETGPTRA